MKITGIVCEYNPLHLGHKKQIDMIRKAEPDGGIVCFMSGNYVQRGAPAIFDKTLRAKAAILSGADLVLEMPVTCSLSSAEGFAATSVSVLSPFCHQLCFGAETADKDTLMALAQALLSADFTPALRQELDKGSSFPAARQKALENMGLDASALSSPNNILAVEYCKAILAQNSAMEPMPIFRAGSYHDTAADQENPSATALRQLIEQDDSWTSFVPEAAKGCFESASVHTRSSGERAILANLRTMTEVEFEALPYGSEGLWRKLMHASREQSTLEDILTAVKSKRYTRTRLDRMVMCAFLGITEEILNAPVPYVRVLAFNDRGRQILNVARNTGAFLNAGQPADDPYQLLENKWGDLYGVFAADSIDPPGAEQNRRVFYRK